MYKGFSLEKRLWKKKTKRFIRFWLSILIFAIIFNFLFELDFIITKGNIFGVSNGPPFCIDCEAIIMVRHYPIVIGLDYIYINNIGGLASHKLKNIKEDIYIFETYLARDEYTSRNRIIGLVLYKTERKVTNDFMEACLYELKVLRITQNETLAKEVCKLWQRGRYG